MPPYPPFWLALALSVVFYWVAPRALRMPLLVVASLLYLASLDAGATLVAALLAAAFYALAPTPQTARPRARLMLTSLVVGGLGYLAVFKYAPQLAARVRGSGSIVQMAIPLGISYFTFKLIHYAVERRRGTLPEHGFCDLLAYVLFFPIYTAGPIERFDHFLHRRAVRLEPQHVSQGLTRLMHGLVKRFALIEVVLPALFGPTATAAELLSTEQSVAAWQVWRFVIATYLYAYLDFSAYADIAIGASRLLGFEIMENFNFPIFARDIADFWRRWHMTLAAWCQSYVYMPLIGLTRNPYLAVYATFLSIGLWHAAAPQWLAWGAYHATGVAVFLTWRRTAWYRRTARWRFLGYPLTFLFVAAGYSFTATLEGGTLYDSLRLMARLFAIDLPAW